VGDPGVTDSGATALEAALGYTFTDPTLLRQALIHRSWSAEVEGEKPNERLEFLGDAVLSLVVAAEVYRRPGLDEGSMAKVRSAVVSEDALAGAAASLGLGEHIMLGRGEEASGGRAKPSILADALEAVLGAVYLDGGLPPARDLVTRLLGEMVAERAEAPGGLDHKTRLQELLAASGRAPEYEVEGTGPDHDRRFTAVVHCGAEVLGRGGGTSKKRAEQDAARAALESLTGPGDA